MTSNTRIARRFLQGIALAAAMQTTAQAQTNACPVLMHPTVVPYDAMAGEQSAMPQPQFGLLPEVPATPALDPAALAGLAGDTRGIPLSSRPDYRLTFAAQNGLHMSFVTPTAPRESEQLRVQGSLAIVSAFIQQRAAARATPGPAETPGSARMGASDSAR